MPKVKRSTLKKLLRNLVMPKRRKPTYSRKTHKEAKDVPTALHEIEEVYQSRHMRGF